MTADLSRFVEAQARVWPDPLREIEAGRKDSHWMWFVFPQLKGLGRSQTALFYGIEDLNEARAYLADPVLGPRLIEISRAALRHADVPAEAIFGSIDAMKLRSCATLFDRAGDDAVFADLLTAFYDGKPCEATLRILKGGDMGC